MSDQVCAVPSPPLTPSLPHPPLSRWGGSLVALRIVSRSEASYSRLLAHHKQLVQHMPAKFELQRSQIQVWRSLLSVCIRDKLRSEIDFFCRRIRTSWGGYWSIQRASWRIAACWRARVPTSIVWTGFSRACALICCSLYCSPDVVAASACALPSGVVGDVQGSWALREGCGLWGGGLVNGEGVLLPGEHRAH